MNSPLYAIAVIFAAMLFLNSHDSQPAPAADEAAPSYTMGQVAADFDLPPGAEIISVTTTRGSDQSVPVWGSGTTVRGEQTTAFMRRGPVRKLISGVRAARLQWLSRFPGPRGKSARARLCGMQARGVF